MAIWEIVDSQSTELERFDLSWLPSAAYRYVTPRVQNARGRVRILLEAGGFVGSLPLLNGDTLIIAPRAGSNSFARMLFVADGLEDALPEGFEDFTVLSFDTSESNSWLALLARSFMERLRLIEKQSLIFDRKQIVARQEYARGRVDVISTTRNLVLGKSVPVRCIFRERDYLTEENQVLATAVRILYTRGLVPATYLQSAVFWMNLLPGSLATEDSLKKVVMRLQAFSYSGPRSYYVPTLLMARLIISEGGIRLSGDAQVDAEPLLTNMPLLFERYVRALVTQELVQRGYLVEKPQNNATSLFTDGTCQLIPDIVVSQGGKSIVVADTKYKMGDAISSADYYQMNTYLEGYGVEQGVLILPMEKIDAPSLVHRKMPNRRTITEMRVPIDNWKISEEFLRSTFLKHLLK